MIIDWERFHQEKLIEAAMEMAIAARTAPKGRGRDLLHTLILTDLEKDTLADRMEAITAGGGQPFFARDAGNLRKAPVILLLGSSVQPLEVAPCGYCGWSDCAENRAHRNPCAIAAGDLGIAVGSAVALAADKRVDNRVWFSAGKAALELGLFPAEVTLAFGIPLSATAKNPFFDRK